MPVYVKRVEVLFHYDPHVRFDSDAFAQLSKMLPLRTREPSMDVIIYFEELVRVEAAPPPVWSVRCLK